MSLRRVSLSLLAAAAVLFAGCGVDQEVAEYCRVIQTCECDADGACCIKQGSSCYEGQCCAGLTCSPTGHCEPEAQ